MCSSQYYDQGIAVSEWVCDCRCLHRSAELPRLVSESEIVDVAVARLSCGGWWASLRLSMLPSLGWAAEASERVWDCPCRRRSAELPRPVSESWDCPCCRHSAELPRPVEWQWSGLQAAVILESVADVMQCLLTDTSMMLLTYWQPMNSYFTVMCCLFLSFATCLLITHYITLTAVLTRWLRSQNWVFISVVCMVLNRKFCNHLFCCHN